jgi:hypothetical protein
MKSSVLWLLPCLAGACAEDRLDVRAASVPELVQLSARDPGADCRPVETLDVSSRPADPPSRQALAAYAAARGANYIALATYRVYDDEDLVVTRARLYGCPLPHLATTP